MKKQLLIVMLAAATILTASASYASGNNSLENMKGYTVHSVIDGRESTTAYDKKGNWVYTIQRYSVDNLDKSIIDKVLSIYGEYGVTGIQKIEQPNSAVVYVVNIENKNSLKTVQIVNDEIQVMQNFKKS